MTRGLRHWTWALPAVLAVLAGSSCSDSSPASSPPRPPAHPPIVMIAFDEFSTTSLLGRGGRIDPVRYPNFAALARGSDWFPYNTASVDQTSRAMAALFTGSTPGRRRPATYRNYPRNLFRALARRYRMRASEEVTAVCPPRLCPGAHFRNQSQVLHVLANGRAQRLSRWLRSLRPASHPTFYFKHVLLPHGPWSYTPSGHRYREGAQSRFPWGVRHFTRWLVNQSYQRHLLQVGFTDRLLGRVLARLRSQGLYDRSLVVVVADNGEGFGRLGNGHEISPRNAADIAVTPLFVKRPYQRGGRIVRRHVRTIDVFPTLARLAHVRLPWRIQGHAIYGRSARRIPRSVLLLQRSGHRVRLSLGGFRRRLARTLRLKLRLLGSGPFDPTVFRIGPYRALQGTPLSRWHRLAPSSTRAVLDRVSDYRSVRLGRELLPLKLVGRLRGPGRRRRASLAVAVNGKIVATAPTFAIRRRGSQRFSVVLPDSALRGGRNLVEVFAVSRSGAGPRLRPLTP
ncbi:MAG: sulfatase-like hydrolase/transferase [Thermoleophilaceae bacterium]